MILKIKSTSFSWCWIQKGKTLDWIIQRSKSFRMPLIERVLWLKFLPNDQLVGWSIILGFHQIRFINNLSGLYYFKLNCFNLTFYENWDFFLKTVHIFNIIISEMIEYSFITGYLSQKYLYINCWMIIMLCK